MLKEAGGKDDRTTKKERLESEEGRKERTRRANER